MRAPLAVRIHDGQQDRHVTAAVRGLSFTKTAPGGHHSASMDLLLPHHLFSGLGPADRVYIYDQCSGRTIWEGYTENPGRETGAGGESWTLSALGGMVLAQDQATRLPYLDRTLAGWRRSDYEPQAPSSTADPGQFPEDAGTRAGHPGLFLQLTPGQPIGNGTQAGVVYDPFVGSSMYLGAFAGFYDGGTTDANYELQWHTHPSVSNPRADSLESVGSTFAIYNGGGSVEIPIGQHALTFRLTRISGGATNVATDDIWGCWGEISVFGQMVDRYGADRDMTGPAHVTYGVEVLGHVMAHDVVEDLLGRVLTMCDPATSLVETTAAEIDQLAPYEAVRAAELFDMLAVFEPDFLWEILETGTGGLHRFRYRAWPSSARYEVSVSDDYSAPGGDADLCNRVAVNWTDKKGEPRTTIRTSVVPELGSRVRDADPISLPDGLGSEGNAERAGDLLLAAKSAPSRAGTAVVSRPLFDHLTARWAMPWEIEPGYMVRVRETGDLLRLTEVTFEDTSVAATLTLGTPQLTEEQLMAQLGGSR